MIDLRSDTITKPTQPMRQAMANAEVGDDVFKDDPTVNALEERVADLLGKPAALFVPSGTMANQIAVSLHANPGDEILIDANAHVYYYEGGASAALSGVMCNTIQGNRVVFTADQVRTKLRPEDEHYPRTKAVFVENTTNRGGGKVWPIDQLQAVADVAKQNQLGLHMDGARLWNAAIALNKPEAELVKDFDTVSVCFSKGLGAPVGSAIAGSKEMIAEAIRIRKRLGGGIRQGGIIAAAALYAIDHHRERLAEDHENAKFFAEGLVDCPGVEINPQDVETNIVVFHLKDRSAKEVEIQLRENGVDVLDMGPRTIRVVTNLMVNRQDIEQALQTFKRLLT